MEILFTTFMEHPFLQKRGSKRNQTTVACQVLWRKDDEEIVKEQRIGRAFWKKNVSQRNFRREEHIWALNEEDSVGFVSEGSRSGRRKNKGGDLKVGGQ